MSAEAVPQSLVQVQVLGPVRAWRGEQELGLGAPQQRVVLAMLAMRAGKGASRDELVDAIWDEPPRNAVSSVHIYVAGLRKVLEPGRGRRAPGLLLVTGGPGYMLRLEAGQLDAAVFGDHLAAARRSRAGGELAAAAGALDAALGLWQGSALGGIGGPWAQIERVRLGEARLAAAEDRAEMMLALGCHGELAGELAGLAGEYPLRERLRCLLMLALYRCGRQADALAVFHDTRRVLDTELGIQPGPALRDLHQQILAGNAALNLPAPGAATVAGRAAGRPVPRELPADVAVFTGRARELADLDRLLPPPGGRAGAGDGPAVVISAVAGTAGVGKTALAVHWAHQVAGRFPDGQLYVNLRGYDPEQPVAPADALAGFLRALGVADQDIPAEPGERAARYRSLLARRRMLVLLDNACTTEQVRPLLPGASSCVSVVTSRDSLAGLVARDGARRLDLDLLPIGDAVDLLRALIGERAADDPEATLALAAQCARLPLALRVAAELAGARPAMPLAGLVGELADQQGRLDLLEVGEDHRTAVRAVFSWSYRHLPPTAASTFRLLGLHPGPDLDRGAAAVLAGVPQELAGRLIGQLARAHLIYASGPDRYGMHDLLRSYARERAASEDGAAAQRAALTRLFNYYLAAAGAAIDTLLPSQPCPARVPAPGGIPRLATPAAARTWLDAERATLVTVIGYCGTHGWPGHATALAAILFSYLDLDGHYSDARRVHTHALDAAIRTGDRAAHADALVNLAGVDWRQGQDQQAARHLHEALAAFREIGDRHGQARALGNLGIVLFRQGRYQHAADHLLRALALSRETDDRGRQARTLDLLGCVTSQQGLYQQATDYHQQALARYRELGDQTREASVLDNLGPLLRRQGRYSQAEDCLREALTLFRKINGRHGEASALDNLGVLLCCQGRYQQATECHEQALVTFREIGDKEGETRALNSFGEVFLATGQAEQAQALHADALTLAIQIGYSYQQARAHAGLARASAATGDLELARHHQQQAISIYTELGVPEAREPCLP